MSLWTNAREAESALPSARRFASVRLHSTREQLHLMLTVLRNLYGIAVVTDHARLNSHDQFSTVSALGATLE